MRPPTPTLSRFKEKRSGVDAARPELKSCVDYLREGDTLLLTRLDRLARSISDLYRIVSQLADKGVEFKVLEILQWTQVHAPASSSWDSSR